MANYLEKPLSEEDIKNRYITPSIESRGWTKDQTRMEYTIKKPASIRQKAMA